MNHNKNKILKKLATHQEHFVSGEEIAGELGISRTAVWKNINKLKEEGYLIESTTKNGYLLHKPMILSSSTILALLNSNSRIKQVKLVDNTPSTQIDAKRLALEVPATDALVISKSQPETRGRFGRSYFAPSNGSFISMSLLVHPQIKFLALTNFTLLAAVAVVSAIEKLTDKKPEIKWVNDIYLNGKKICGILSEATTDLESNQITNVIIGVGINFNIQPQEFPPDLQKKATSIFVDEVPYLTRNELIAEIWNQFYQLETTDFLKIYRNHSFILGKTVTFSEEGRNYSGIARHITDIGQLVIELANGQTKFKILNSGEVSLKDWK